jgi:hypothetical protein
VCPCVRDMGTSELTTNRMGLVRDEGLDVADALLDELQERGGFAVVESTLVVLENDAVHLVEHSPPKPALRSGHERRHRGQDDEHGDPSHPAHPADLEPEPAF